ncbi:MAG: hypothetical protein ACR2LK_09695 [Solirubrobacteraceae bacterium]
MAGWQPGAYRVVVGRDHDKPTVVVRRDTYDADVLPREEWLSLVTALAREALERPVSDVPSPDPEGEPDAHDDDRR